MPVRMTVSTGNLRGLVANLYAADAVMQRKSRETVRTYGRKQWRLARQLAPVSSEPTIVRGHVHAPGFLRDAIRLRFSEDGLVYEVGWREEDFIEADEPFYALYTEFGTRFMKARPCVFPARDAIAPEFKRALGTNVRGAIRRQRRPA
jgi:HK97 gp10 family phage protein